MQMDHVTPEAIKMSALEVKRPKHRSQPQAGSVRAGSFSKKLMNSFRR